MTKFDELANAQQIFDIAEQRLRRQLIIGDATHNQPLWNAYNSAESALLSAERDFAAEQQLPYAIEWQIDSEWPRMAQNAVLMTGSFMFVLTFDGAKNVLQIVFQHPDAVRFSCVSDEIITGHTLFGKGLRAYGLFKVVNSTWINELRICDAVHPQHNEAHWKAAEHYLLCFKDRMCEVVTSKKPSWHSFTTKNEALRSSLAHCDLVD